MTTREKTTMTTRRRIKKSHERLLTFLVLHLIMYREWIFLPHLLISVISWIQFVIIEDVKQRRLTRYDAIACGMLFHSGLVRWIAALALITRTLEFQLLCAMTAQTISWTSLVIILNNGFILPSRNQIVSLMFSLLITGLWESGHRLAVLSVK